MSCCSKQLAAIIDLERLSRDLLQEKKEKRKLEARIREMSSQLLGGGVVDTQALRSAIATVCSFGVVLLCMCVLYFGVLFIYILQSCVCIQEQDRIRREYDDKVSVLDRERQNMEEDKGIRKNAERNTKTIL